MTLADLLVRLGSFGLDLTWHVECDPSGSPHCGEVARSSVGTGIDTLSLLSLTAPRLRLVDAEARGYDKGALVVSLSEVDSWLWDVRVADETILHDMRRYYPDAEDL